MKDFADPLPAADAVPGSRDESLVRCLARLDVEQRLALNDAAMRAALELRAAVAAVRASAPSSRRE